ncbi:MAG: CAP domain-containing protein [Deltaproteobacteria bacterium]|nr:CAP domain-containing protein [Deltaproteobacteria bacterium]
MLGSNPDAGRWSRRARTAAALIVVVLASACDGSVPSVDRYNDGIPDYDRNRGEKLITGELMDIANKADLATPMVRDAALEAAARNTAVALRRDGLAKVDNFDTELAHEYLDAMGVTDSAFRSLYFNVLFPGQAAEIMKQNLDIEALTEQFTNYGVGAVHSAWPPGYIVAVYLTRKQVNLDPLPRRIAKGMSIDIAGTILVPLTDLRINVDGPFGTDRYLPEIRGTRFAAVIPTTSTGEHRIEVTVVTDQGPEVAALMTVEVGDTGPSLGNHEDIAYRSIRGVADGRARLLELINQRRAKENLPPVIIDDRLNTMAQAHAEEMRQTGKVSHISKISGDIADRARKENIDFARITENVAVDQRVEDAHISFDKSASHRENMLDPEVDRVGIGIAFSQTSDSVYVVENYAKFQ